MTATPRIVRTTATPRIARAVALPSAPRLRRVTGVNTRPLGKISLVLAATCVLGLTAVGYVAQTGQAVQTSYQIRELNARLNADLNTQETLQNQIQQRKTYSAIYDSALKLGLTMPDPSTAHFIPAPGPVTIKYVISYAPPRPAVRSVHVATTNAAMTSWWQGLWSALYHVTR
jgi:cell division protein FtsL